MRKYIVPIILTLIFSCLGVSSAAEIGDADEAKRDYARRLAERAYQEERWQDLGKAETIKAMSDHRPIWIKIPYTTEDRD